MNIYKIKQDLIAIFDELEENGGEITSELEEKLAITQEEFKNKIEDYTNVIKSLDSDMNAIKNEQARLKALCDKKEKVSKKLKEIIINAINEFGDTKKSGVKYLDYGTGEVSVRKTPIVKVNDDLVKEIGFALERNATYNKSINQLDVCDHVNIMELTTDYNASYNVEVTESDLTNINVDLSINIPLKDLATGAAYPVFKEAIKYTDCYKISTNVSKTELKPKLKENGAYAPNIAKLDINENLTIK